MMLTLFSQDPKNGAPVSGTWAVRETFVAIITTNFPMAFTLARGMLSPAFKPLRTSSHTEGQQQQKQSEGLQTFGSSGGNMKARGGGNPTFTNMLCSESEERMVNGESPLAEELPSWSSPTLQSDSVYGSKSGPEK